ncbi:MAG: sugar transferase [Chitinophagaceae bacterium]|nr:sugar transferase [Chitinophagaceae bacterium]
MESSLPKTHTTEKVYKHFLLDPHPVKDSFPFKRIDFFYIGADAFKIDFLVKSFEGGYALESVTSAIPFLKRNAEKQSVPGIIIIDGKVGATEINNLQKFISSTTTYSKVPILVDGSDLNENELQSCRTLRFIDEIVFLKEVSKEKLIAKSGFLRKVKSRTDYHSLNNNIKHPVRVELSIPLFFKRLFDIITSGLSILILSPVFLIIAALIKMESKGPVFYIAQRAGKGYKIFRFYKFRTMVADADKKVNQLAHLNQYTHAEDGPVFFKISNDPRITKIGAFLRNTSLDELPQLLNVFLGDMSLVGNRPLPLYEAATLTTDEHAARFMAPAGITGLWQIKKRGDSNMSVEERISLDIDYAHKFSFAYDLWIMANTPTALLQKENV